MSPRSVVNLGILGLPDDWDQRYSAALAALGRRICISAVYDSLPLRCDEVARTIAGRPLHGARAMLNFSGLDALLLLDGQWQRSWLLQVCHASGLPVFLGQRVLRDAGNWQSDLGFPSESEAVVVPETLLRYYPSMLRLRELMATDLGPLRKVRFLLPRAQQVLDRDLSLRELLNWFRTICGSLEPVNCENGPQSPPAPRFCFRSRTRSGQSVSLEVCSEGLEIEDALSGPLCTVECERGRAEIAGPRELRWWPDSGSEISEQLDADRSATRVALDLFTRRVAGGLIPVPDLSDLKNAQLLADRALAANFL